MDPSNVMSRIKAAHVYVDLDKCLATVLGTERGTCRINGVHVGAKVTVTLEFSEAAKLAGLLCRTYPPKDDRSGRRVLYPDRGLGQRGQVAAPKTPPPPKSEAKPKPPPKD